MNELMERLARANPTPTGEPPTVEERHEADAVLERILASPAPVERPLRRPAPALRRIAPAAGLLAIAAIAAIVVIDLLGSEQERGGGIIERAAAAVSQENVIYAITERHVFDVRALEPGARLFPEERSFVRSYVWSGGNRSRFLNYRLRPDGGPGRLRTEAAVTEDAIRWYDPESNTIDVVRRGSRADSTVRANSDYPGFSPFSNPGAQLRAHVNEGRLRVAGTATVQGRTAYRLVSPPLRFPKQGVERETITYLVDAGTYLPLEVRQRTVSTIDGRQLIEARIEYLRYERLRVTAKNKRLLEMAPHPGARTGDTGP